VSLSINPGNITAQQPGFSLGINHFHFSRFFAHGNIASNIVAQLMAGMASIG
jgi:hypothetical protein